MPIDKRLYEELQAKHEAEHRDAELITYGGISFTLIRAYRAGEKRGDW
jgi:hypothetical protein